MKISLTGLKNRLFLLLFLGALDSCGKSETEQQFAKMEWLLGTWQTTIVPKTTEKWEAISDEHYKAQSFMLEKKDTIFSEEIEIKIVDGAVYYIPSFEGQSGDNAAQFKLVAQQDSQVTFENKQHDYPQRIIYQLLSADTLQARLEGKQGGLKKDFTYTFTKVNHK